MGQAASEGMVSSLAVHTSSRHLYCAWFIGTPCICMGRQKALLQAWQRIQAAAIRTVLGLQAEVSIYMGRHKAWFQAWQCTKAAAICTVLLCRRRTVSAWEGRRHRFKPGSASKQRPASATSAKACLDTWTPLKTWMVACLDKQIPTSKTAAILGEFNVFYWCSTVRSD